MACVHLSNLFEEDKNFYGLLKGLEEFPTKISMGTHPITEKKIELTEEGMKTFDYLQSKPIKKIFKTEFNYPEWFFKGSGYIINGDLYTFTLKDKSFKIEWMTLYYIDVREWLKQQNKDKLKAIADKIFFRREDNRQEKIKDFVNKFYAEGQLELFN